MKAYPEIIQGTEEWHSIRRGKITASEFSSVLAKGQGKVRRAYMLKLAAERLTGLTEPTYTNSYMEDGKEREISAREYYEQLNGVEVQQVGFIELNEDVGCSPDGLIDDDGGIEIKCPKSTTHIETILDNKVPTVYTAQIQGNLWVSGRKWWDFVSFDARVQENPFWCFRVKRDESYIKMLDEEINKFANESRELIEQIRNGI